jgi:hypothetical protein
LIAPGMVWIKVKLSGLMGSLLVIANFPTELAEIM